MTTGNKKKVKRIKYRVSFIFLFALLCFITAFTLYMKNDEDLHLPGGLFESDDAGTDDSFNIPGDGAVIIADSAPKKTGNPLPESKAISASYIDSCLFIGSPVLSGLFEYDIAKNANVISDAQINSSNLAKLLIKRGSDNKTVKNILMDEKAENIYILLSPEAELDTDALTDFCEDITSGNKNAEIYFISALPSKNNNSDEFNKALLDFCDTAGVHYLDFNTAVVGNDGGIASEYADGDRLSRAGCQFLSEYILTHVAD
jgi:hypothetical protein